MNGANSGERSPLGPPPAVARFSTHSETAVLSKGGLVASGWILADPGRISPGFYSKTFLDEHPAPALRVWGGAIYQKHQKTLIKKNVLGERSCGTAGEVHARRASARSSYAHVVARVCERRQAAFERSHLFPRVPHCAGARAGDIWCSAKKPVWFISGLSCPPARPLLLHLPRLLARLAAFSSLGRPQVLFLLGG